MIKVMVHLNPQYNEVLLYLFYVTFCACLYSSVKFTYYLYAEESFLQCSDGQEITTFYGTWRFITIFTIFPIPNHTNLPNPLHGFLIINLNIVLPCNKHFPFRLCVKCRRCEYKVRDEVGFEVHTAVVVKSTIFWDITLHSPLSINQRFGGTYRLHLQGRKISWARNQHESRWQAEVFFLRYEVIWNRY
jgi:hypothetical protein